MAKSSRYEMPAGTPKAHKEHDVEVQRGPMMAHVPTMQTKSHRDFADEERDMMASRRDGQVLKMHKPKE
jgi:hypothetical protein